MINKSIYYNRNMKMQLTQSGDQFGFNNNSMEKTIEREANLKSKKTKMKRGLNSKFKLPLIETSNNVKDF